MQSLPLAATLCLALAPTAPAQPAPAQPAAPATVADAPPKPTEKQLRAWWNEQAKFKLPANTYVEFEYEQPEQRVHKRVRIWSFKDGAVRVAEETPGTPAMIDSSDDPLTFLDAAIMPDGRRWLWADVAETPQTLSSASRGGKVRVVDGNDVPLEYEPSRLVKIPLSYMDMLMASSIPHLNGQPSSDPTAKYNFLTVDPKTNVTLGWTLGFVNNGTQQAWVPVSDTIVAAKETEFVGHTIRYSDHRYAEALERWTPGSLEVITPTGQSTLTIKLLQVRYTTPDETAVVLTALPRHNVPDFVRGESNIEYIENYDAQRKQSVYTYADRPSVTASHLTTIPRRATLGIIAVILSGATVLTGIIWIVIKQAKSSG